MAAALVVGLILGLVVGRRWSMLVTPMVYVLVFELARSGVSGPLVDAPTFNTTFGVLALILGRGIHALLRMDAAALGRRFRPATPARWIAGFMLFVAVGLTVAYGAMSMSFVTTGQMPEIITLTGHVTNVVFALDLSLVVPWFVLAAVLLWQRRSWGYVLATLLNVKGAVYMLALSAATMSGVQRGVSEDLSQLGLWAFIGVGSLIASVVLIGNVEPRVAGLRQAT